MLRRAIDRLRGTRRRKCRPHYLVGGRRHDPAHGCRGEARLATPGQSRWRGIEDVNSASIGSNWSIPAMNSAIGPSPRSRSTRWWPLVSDIKERYGITRGNVVGHSDVAPTRKQDPGRTFPVESIGEGAAGAAPADEESDGPDVDRCRFF